MLCKRISLSCVEVYWTLKNVKYHKLFLKMGECNAWNVEINILVYQNEIFSLPAEFHFINWPKQVMFCIRFDKIEF